MTEVRLQIHKPIEISATLCFCKQHMCELLAFYPSVQLRAISHEGAECNVCKPLHKPAVVEAVATLAIKDVQREGES